MFTGQGRIDAIHVNYKDDILHVDIEGIAPKPKIKLTKQEMEDKLQSVLDLFQQHLKQKLNSPVIVEIDVIPVDLLNARFGMIT